jgi:hypothetical protein
MLRVDGSACRVARDFHLRVYVREPARRGAPHRDSVFDARTDGAAVADGRAALDGMHLPDIATARLVLDLAADGRRQPTGHHPGDGIFLKRMEADPHQTWKIGSEGCLGHLQAAVGRVADSAPHDPRHPATAVVRPLTAAVIARQNLFSPDPRAAMIVWERWRLKAAATSGHVRDATLMISAS